MLLTLTTKFNITAEQFETMYDIFTAEDGNDKFNALSQADKALYWQMYEAMEQYYNTLNPRPVIVKATRRSRKAA